MSSMIRSMQKRIYKRMGYKRQAEEVQMISGSPVVVKLKAGEGEIMNRTGDSLGHSWPFTIPSLGKPKKGKPHAVRGSRRGKPNKAWLAQAAAKRVSIA